MTDIVLDYSNWRPPSPQSLLSAGVVGVSRYIAPQAWGWPKAVTPSELAGLLAAGVQVALNFEAGQADYLGGFNTGVNHAHAIATALAELGVHSDTPVYVSIDTNVAVSGFGTAESYLSGLKQVLGPRPLGLYGEGALIEDCVAKGLVVYGWESESTSFPGNNQLTPHTVLVQRFGESVPLAGANADVNHVVKPDWGQLPRPAPPGPPPPKVPQQYNPPKTDTYVSILRMDQQPVAGTGQLVTGTWELQPDWGVITRAGSFYGTMHGNPAVLGRTPALILPAGAPFPGANPPLASYPDWAVYECIATSGERYLPAQP